MSVWHYPATLHYLSNAANGMTPNSWLWRQLVAAENHATAFRRRQVYGKSLELGTDVTGATALAGRWRFRTSYGVDRVSIVMLMGLTSAAAGAGSTADPITSVTFTPSGGAALTPATFNYGVSTATINDAPDEHLVMTADIDVVENTAYECSMTNAGAARPMAIMVYEQGTTTIDEAVSYFNTHSPVGGSPIYDADRERLLVGLSNLWLKGGGMNAHWSLFDGTARTRVSATAANAIDGTTTGTPTATHQGFYLDPRYHRSQSRTTVAMEWGVYASMSAGTGVCRLIDTAGNTYGSINVNSAVAQWWTATFSIPEAAEIFLVPQLAGNGAGTISLFAASIIETE